MPMPVSEIDSVPASASGLMRMVSAEEDVGLGIDRVHHQVQQLAHFRLKGVGLGNRVVGIRAHAAPRKGQLAADISRRAAPARVGL